MACLGVGSMSKYTGFEKSVNKTEGGILRFFTGCEQLAGKKDWESVHQTGF